MPTDATSFTVLDKRQLSRIEATHRGFSTLIGPGKPSGLALDGGGSVYLTGTAYTG